MNVHFVWDKRFASVKNTGASSAFNHRYPDFSTGATSALNHRVPTVCV